MFKCSPKLVFMCVLYCVVLYIIWTTRATGLYGHHHTHPPNLLGDISVGHTGAISVRHQSASSRHSVPSAARRTGASRGRHTGASSIKSTKNSDHLEVTLKFFHSRDDDWSTIETTKGPQQKRPFRDDYKELGKNKSAVVRGIRDKNGEIDNKIREKNSKSNEHSENKAVLVGGLGLNDNVKGGEKIKVMRNGTILPVLKTPFNASVVQKYIHKGGKDTKRIPKNYTEMGTTSDRASELVTLSKYIDREKKVRLGNNQKTNFQISVTIKPTETSKTVQKQNVNFSKASKSKADRAMSSKKPLNSSHTLCMSFLAGTGNRIFQFASGLAIAKNKNLTFVIPENLNRFSEAFVIPADISFNVTRCEKAKSIGQKGIGVYSTKPISQVTGQEDVSLHGYFQSYKYFQHQEKLVRDSLQFRPEVSQLASDRLATVLKDRYNMSIDIRTRKQNRDSAKHSNSNDPVFVGLHVRRGDKAKDERIVSVGYKVASDDYIRDAIKLVRSRYPNSIIVVVSDDTKWCKETPSLSKTSNVIILDNLPWTASLALLSFMDHVIITVGTFGWWGAWLAGGDAIYYKDFLTPGSKMDQLFINDDVFLPSWTGL